MAWSLGVISGASGLVAGIAGAAIGASIVWYCAARKCAGCEGKCKRCAALREYAVRINREIKNTAKEVANIRGMTVEEFCADQRAKEAQKAAGLEQQRGRMNWAYGALPHDNVAAQ